jgi:hypothetical protein
VGYYAEANLASNVLFSTQGSGGVNALASYSVPAGMWMISATIATANSGSTTNFSGMTWGISTSGTAFSFNPPTNVYKRVDWPSILYGNSYSYTTDTVYTVVTLTTATTFYLLASPTYSGGTSPYFIAGYGLTVVRLG